MKRRLLLSVLLGVVVQAGCKSGEGSDEPKPVTTPPSDAAAVPNAAASSPAAAPATPVAKPPVDLASLPEWRSPDAEPAAAPGVRVHAADAEASWLLTLLASRDAIYAATADASGRVTGRAQARDFPGARAALVAATPSLRVGTEHKRKGTGRKVDLHQPAADPHYLFRLLADVLGVNVVVAPQKLPRLALVAGAVPGDAVLHAAASALGLSVQRRGKTWFLLRGDDMSAADRLIATKGPRIDLDVKDATAHEIVSLLELQTKLPLTTDCGQSARTDLRLRKAPIGHALAAIALTTGARLASDPAKPCPAPTTLEQLDAKSRLIGVVYAGKRAAALFRTATGLAGVRQGDKTPIGRVDVGLGFVAFTGDGDSARHVQLHPDDPMNGDGDDAEELVQTIAQSRLAATIVGDEQQLALLEGPDGETWAIRVRAGRLEYLRGPGTWTTGDLDALELTLGAKPVQIEPGSVTFVPPQDPGLPAAEPVKLPLRPR